MKILSRFTQVLVTLALSCGAATGEPRSPEYEAVQTRLARGWNTWDTHSVTAQVILPEAFTLRVGLKHNSALNSDAFLADALIGRQNPGAEQVFPGPHTWNGSYTELRLAWQGHELRLQTGHDGEDLVMLVTPLASNVPLPATLVVSAGVLWNRPGSATKSGDHLEFNHDSHQIRVYWTALEETATSVPLATPFLAALFKEPIGVSTGHPRTVAEIRAVLDHQRPAGNTVPGAIETVIGWDTIYEPTQSRVISPVSRIWNLNWGGYVLFDWDTYFAAAMAVVGSRDLAYANAVEITREFTPAGFIPNYARAGGWKSFDRSEPPVGAITVLALYRQFREIWLLRDTFPALLAWNRWWVAHRDRDGYLVWGTDADNLPLNPDDHSVGARQGAMYESGLDNSPTFDGVPFHPETHVLHQADVGLMGLFIADCNALADIAETLGKQPEELELRERSAHYREKLQTLWDEKSGSFLNKNLDNGVFSPRLAPTNFYPLLARAATPGQAERIIREHLQNPAEFGGEWVIPAIARSDPAFKDQEYWRGRIWGPMNYLVYLGLRNYEDEAPDARRELAQKSLALFQKEWLQKGHVHENYNAITGEGDDVSSSDRFYHWGALLGLINCLENTPSEATATPR
jgi:hypothetical protein